MVKFSDNPENQTIVWCSELIWSSGIGFLSI